MQAVQVLGKDEAAKLCRTHDPSCGAYGLHVPLFLMHQAGAPVPGFVTWSWH